MALADGAGPVLDILENVHIVSDAYGRKPLHMWSIPRLTFFEPSYGTPHRIFFGVSQDIALQAILPRSSMLHEVRYIHVSILFHCS